MKKNSRLAVIGTATIIGVGLAAGGALMGASALDATSASIVAPMDGSGTPTNAPSGAPTDAPTPPAPVTNADGTTTPPTPPAPGTAAPGAPAGPATAGCAPGQAAPPAPADGQTPPTPPAPADGQTPPTPPAAPAAPGDNGQQGTPAPSESTGTGS